MSVHGFTVYDMIARGAFVHGDAPALIQGERQLSFREFQHQADALAGGLAAVGIEKGDRICVLAQNDTAYLTLYGACARQGIIAYPINWRLTAQEVERVVERAAPRMMVVDASTLPVVAGWPERQKSVAHWYQFGEPVGPGFTPFATLSRGAVEPPVADVAPDDPFAVISTAAVDVVPRGAALTHANVIPQTSRPWPASVTTRRIPTCWRYRCSTSPRSAWRWPTCTPAVPAWGWRAS